MQTTKISVDSTSKPPLGRVDWLRTALELLVSDGVDAVQITRLAKVLNVTRGSFYWHFKSRDDLLSAILVEWHAANNEFFSHALEGCETLDEGVLRFFEIWVGRDQFSPELDQAVRDWARLDPDVLRLVREEDGRRLLSIATMFSLFGFATDEANVRARVLYFSQVGYTAINLGEALSERLSLLERYYNTYTGRDLNEGIAAQFIQKMRRTM